MGYSLSERAFKYAEIYLDELIEAEQDEFEWEINDSRDFARRLRQGIKAAEKLGYEKYKDLLNKFKFKELPNKVIAVRRVVQVAKPVGLHRKKFLEITNLSGLITTAIQNSHINVLQFPDVNLSDEDKEQLHKFCKAKGWAFSLTNKELQKCQATESELEKVTN